MHRHVRVLYILKSKKSKHINKLNACLFMTWDPKMRHLMEVYGELRTQREHANSIPNGQ